MFSYHIRNVIVVTLVMVLHFVYSDGNNSSISILPTGQPRLPLWKSLLTHHHRWTGYYVHDQNRFVCNMYVHSVQFDSQGVAHVSFTSDGIHIEMNGISDDDETVIFRETHIWNKSRHFESHPDLVFDGEFMPHLLYYQYKANVSSMKGHNFGTVSLTPQGKTLRVSKDEKKSVRLALAIGIPLFVGTVVLTLAIFIIIWAVRKGYLRHVPWAYKNFRNPSPSRSSVEMREEESEEPATVTVTVEGVETAAVHM